MESEIEYEMGIDEAGRGPVLGPMVYGCCMWPISQKEEFAKFGFDDSKKLTEAKREELFKIIMEMNIYNQAIIHHPQSLSEQMLGNANYKNLNEISHQSAMDLIQKVLDMNDKKYKLKTVYLDTVGPKDSYKQKLVNNFKNPNIEFIVSEKADSKYPVVSAASIVAKVTRDKIMYGWKFEIEDRFGKNTGSGYASDPNTQKWLTENFVPILGYPPIVRFSWSTVTKAMKEKNLEVEYFMEKELWDKDKENEIQQNKNENENDFMKIKFKNFRF